LIIDIEIQLIEACPGENASILPLQAAGKDYKRARTFLY
jgi:hypothetical protein